MSPATTACVLTVDDDPIVRADLRLILEDAGFDVCPSARDGVEAVHLARAHRPDLVLIDLSLPGIDGVEATRRILQERHVPIVALTGHRSGHYVERAIGAGAVAHVLKPFHEAHLVETIARALASVVPQAIRDAWALAAHDRERERAAAEERIRQGYTGRARPSARHASDLASAWYLP